MVTTQSSMTRLFRNHHKLIVQIVHQFWTRYGGEWEERRAEAYSLFLEAVRSWKPSKGKLSTWIHHKINYGLMESIRQRRLEHRRIPVENNSPDSLPGQSDSIRFRSIVLDSSPDAQKVIYLLVEVPKGLQKYLLQTDHLRLGLWQFLYYQLKWDQERIQKAFRQIEEAIDND